MNQNQRGNHSNNFQVGKAGSANTFNVKQNHSSPDSTELQEVNGSQAAPISHQSVRNRTGILFALILPFVGLLADVLGIFGSLHLMKDPKLWLFYTSLVIAYYITNLDRFRIARTAIRHQDFKKGDAYVGAGKVARLNRNNTYTLYERSAKCTYPMSTT
ncbi:hypothetical protein [Chroococcidiopsis sp.]|uniref:hypothetical protein n=1 Tax=Chroococcidiopsis sp. TaxID=3088168 RepID=UPI003F2CE7E4